MRFNIKTGQIEISLFELCGGFGGRASFGAEFEELIGKFLPEIYAGGAVAEISTVIACGGVDFLVTGSALAVCGDEIKVFDVIFEGGETAARNFSAGGGALCAAYLLCLMKQKTSAKIETVRFNTETDEKAICVKDKKTSELGAAMSRRLAKKMKEAAELAARGRTVLPAAAAVTFPYSQLRAGQELMMRECYDAMLSGERLFVQAPTGIGKTMSTLYPAVKFLGNGRCDKIFYLTAKISAQNEAYRAAGMLFEAGARLRTIMLTSKENCCLSRVSGMGEHRCDPRRCPYAGASNETIGSALESLMHLKNGYEIKVITKAAREYCVCPYELSLALSERCEIIIADYNYVFDPLVRLRRYFEEESGGRYVFLVDEAHNLADRTRSMYSAELELVNLTDFQRSLNGEVTPLAKALGALIEYYKKKLRCLCRADMVRGADGRERGYYTARECPRELAELVGKLKSECAARLRRRTTDHTTDQVAPAIAVQSRLLSRFLCAVECFDERFLFFCEIDGERIRTNIYCLDPSRLIEECLERADAAVMFSATLTPLDYFSDILGGGSRSRRLSLASPFDPENLFIAAADNISTRFDDRADTLAKTVSYIAAAVSGKRGNYIVYFPSYAYMERAAGAFAAKYPRVVTVIQKRGMTRSQKEEFIDEFKRGDSLMRVGFCVLGGSFAEGIDLPGSSLIGAIIVGVGIPGLSNERNIIRDYYELSRGAGYDYAYTYPGMNNVLQAAGRVIRSDGDRGIVLLIDDRYATPQYAAMRPEHWDGMQHFDSAASLNAAILSFWKQKQR